MSPKARQVIRKYAVKRSPDAYLFDTVKRDHMTAGSLLQLVRRGGTAAGVSNANVHRFSHTFALFAFELIPVIWNFERFSLAHDKAWTRMSGYAV